MARRYSVRIAKDRLKVLVVSDRMKCKPEAYERISHELYQVLAKYIEITPEEFEVSYSRTHVHIRLTGEKQ